MNVENVLSAAQLAAAGYIYTKERAKCQQMHEADVALTTDLFIRETHLTKQAHLMSTIADIELTLVQLDADLNNAMKESVRDMYDQRNQQLQTLVVADSLMLTALITLIIQGIIPPDTNEVITICFGATCGISFALLICSVVLCIETLKLASNYMIVRALMDHSSMMEKRQINAEFIHSFRKDQLHHKSARSEGNSIKKKIALEEPHYGELYERLRKDNRWDTSDESAKKKKDQQQQTKESEGNMASKNVTEKVWGKIEHRCYNLAQSRIDDKEGWYTLENAYRHFLKDEEPQQIIGTKNNSNVQKSNGSTKTPMSTMSSPGLGRNNSIGASIRQGRKKLKVLNEDLHKEDAIKYPKQYQERWVFHGKFRIRLASFFHYFFCWFCSQKKDEDDEDDVDVNEQTRPWFSKKQFDFGPKPIEGDEFIWELHSFEDYWKITCEKWADRATITFYAGTAFLLFATILWCWAQFTINYHSKTAGVVCISFIIAGLVVGFMYQIYITPSGLPYIWKYDKKKAQSRRMQEVLGQGQENEHHDEQNENGDFDDDEHDEEEEEEEEEEDVEFTEIDDVEAQRYRTPAAGGGGSGRLGGRSRR